MQIDENLLSQVSDFLSTSEGAEIMADIKNMLGKGTKSKSESEGPDLSSLFSQVTSGGKQKESSPLENIDVSQLIPLVSAISSAKTDNRATNLLLALRPLLDKKRQPKIDRAVSIMKIMALLPILEEHGFRISDIFS